MTESNEAVERTKVVAAAMMRKLKIENGMVTVEALRDALNELLDPSDGSEPSLVAPYPSKEREVLWAFLSHLRAQERAR